MKCGKCEYDLSGISNLVRCPECGTTDWTPRPLDQSWRWLKWVSLAATLTPVASILLVHIMLVAARLQLGRWPGRYGADDPKSIPFVSDLHTLTSFVIFLGIPLAISLSMCIPLSGAIWAKSIRLPRSRLDAAKMSMAVWTACYIFIRLDPAEAFVWFMD